MFVHYQVIKSDNSSGFTCRIMDTTAYITLTGRRGRINREHGKIRHVSKSAAGRQQWRFGNGNAAYTRIHAWRTIMVAYRVISRILELGVSAVTGGCLVFEFGAWDREAAGAQSAPRTAEGHAGVGAGRWSPPPIKGVRRYNPRKFLTFCMQNLAFWRINGDNLVYIKAYVTGVLV